MSELLTGRPEPHEYAPFYADYVGRTPDADISAALAEQVDALVTAFGKFPPARHGFRYAPGKWSVRELANHLIDGERVFSYRALRFARGDDTPLPGFEENLYVENGGAEQRQLSDIVDELVLLRRANVLLFRALPKEAWLRGGLASDNYMSVRALAYVMVGHTRHHLEVLGSRYTVS